MRFRITFYIFTFLFLQTFTVSSQCTMNEFYYESFEYTTPIPGLLANKVYHTSPQTNQFAEAAYTGTYGMYMNIIDGQTGVIYRNPINDLCVGKTYELSFVYRNATSAITGNNLVNQSYYSGPGGTGTNFSVGAAINSSQTLYAYSGYQGCFDEEQLIITITANPVITAGPNDTICAGDLSSIIATSATSGLTYTWNPGTIQSAELNVSPASTMFYNVTAVDANGCASNLISRLVVVRPKPNVSLSIAEDTLCFGDNVLLIASSTSTGISYSWSDGTSTLPQITVSPTNSTSYWVQVTNQQNCTASDTVQVYVIPELQLNITGNNTLCEGESTTLFASGNIPQMTFEWEGVIAGDNYFLTPTQNGYVGVVGSYGNCPQASDSIFITVNANPTVIPALDVTLCKGETNVAIVSASPESSVIHWPSLGGVTGNSQTITALEVNTFKFTLNTWGVSQL